MKIKLYSILFIILSIFILKTTTSPVVIKDIDLTPTKTYHHKRDVIDLHNSGSKTKTETETATYKSKNAPTPLPASSSFSAIYGGNGITPQNGVAGAFLIVLGIYLMIFGFKSFRITLAVCGFLTFGLITWVAMANNQSYYGYVNNDITLIAVPAGLGILGAIIYAIFWNISIYLVGAMSGLTLALYIMCCKANLLITSPVARAAFMIALSFFMSLVTFFAEKYVLLFTFAWVGSYCFIVGIDLLAHTGYLAGIKSILDGNRYHQVVYVISRKVIVLIVFIVIICVISFGWQYMYNANQKFGVVVVPEEKEKKEDKGEKKDDGPGDPGPVDLKEPHIESKD